MFTGNLFVLAANLMENWPVTFEWVFSSAETVFLALVAFLLLWEAMGLRYISNNQVGIVERLWSRDLRRTTLVDRPMSNCRFLSCAPKADPNSVHAST